MDNLILEGNHYQIGGKLGEFFNSKKTHFPIKLHRDQLEFGKKSAVLLNKPFPKVGEEIQGIMDRIDTDHDIFISWLSCMGCCLRIRENHNVEARG
ncbi:MAG: hypothetical protein HQK54_14255 [Oligoflexales bacterium]|nr:hypothetical protein [Oligoflexales bacterium]